MCPVTFVATRHLLAWDLGVLVVVIAKVVVKKFADGELGSGDGHGEMQKRTERESCHICTEEPPNQSADKISLAEPPQRQLILSERKKIVNALSRNCPPIAANRTQTHK